MAKLWTTYRLPGSWNRLTIGGGVNWQSQIHFTATPWDLGKTVTGEQSSYAVVNLMGRYDFSKQLTATLNVNNLFNRKYLSALDQTFYTGYYGAPRNAMLNLRYSF
jgi:outer membrane receptor for ferric coprogen and ferric-rhodotorulic acid